MSWRFFGILFVAPILSFGRAASAEPSPASGTPASTDAAPPEEVTVQGRKPDPGTVALGKTQVRDLPGAFGDAFRAIEAFPGVVPMASGLPYFFIRGAPPGDTAFFIDGVRVPLLFHAGLGPSVIHPDLVERADFFPGGAPVQYGGAVGGVLAATLPPPTSIAHAEGVVRSFDAGALAETPFADGRGSALAAGRYSYSGAIVSAISPIKLGYADYQTRVTWDLDAKNRIGVLAFGSFDDFGQEVDGVTDTILHDQFHRVDLRYDHALDNGAWRVATTFGYGRSSNDEGEVQDWTVGARASLVDRVAPEVLLRAGGDATLDRFDRLDAPVDVLYPPRVDVAIGAYADVVWQLGPRVQLVPGLRAGIFASHRYDDPSAELAQLGEPPSAVTSSALPAIDPQLSARIDLTRDVAAVSSIRVAHQPAAYVVPVPGLSVVEPNPVLQASYQMSQGVAVALPAGFTAQVTGFLHTYVNLTDLTATCPSIFTAGILTGNAPTVTDSLCLALRTRGQAFGGELLVRRNIARRLSGWVSYTLSRSTRSGPVDLDAPVLQMPAAFDRTHVVNVVASYDVGAGWRAGARLVAYSGLPYSDTRMSIIVPPYDGERMPAFYRVDVRLEKRWTFSQNRMVAVVFEAMNATLNKETLVARCGFAPGEKPGTTDPCAFETLGPVTVPSVGVEGVL